MQQCYTRSPSRRGQVEVPNPASVLSQGTESTRLDLGPSSGALPHNLVALPDDAFGFEMAHLGDLDGDGAPEVIVGAPTTNEGALNAGAVWIVGISPTPVRNGVGTNPLTLSSPQAPVIGAPFDASLDCSAQAPGLAILLGWDTPIEGLHLAQGELLLDPFNGSQVFARVALHVSDTQNFSIAVPLDPSLIDFVLYAQGVCAGLPAAQLSNGLAFVIGD